MCVLLIVVEMTAAKMGAVTGKGFAALIRESFGIRLTALAMLALAHRQRLHHVLRVRRHRLGHGDVRRIEIHRRARRRDRRVAAHRRRQLQTRGESVPYLVAGVPRLRDRGVLGAANWENAAINTIVPHVVYQQSFVSLVISMIGTTIAPWMMFFNQSNVVEKGIKPDELFTQKVDVVSGTVAACLVAWFIIVTTGTVLYPQGIVISDAADAAAALAPFAANMPRPCSPSA